MMPAQRPATSEQTVCTPTDFLTVVERRFGMSQRDLAALESNAVTDTYFGPDHKRPEYRDSLQNEWHPDRCLLWLNPPFSNIAAFAKKAAAESKQGARVAMLVPCGNTRWWIEHVQPYAYEFRLFPRLTFKGHKSPFPKDLNLYLYDRGLTGSQPWNWKA